MLVLSMRGAVRDGVSNYTNPWAIKDVELQSGFARWVLSGVNGLAYIRGLGCTVARKLGSELEIEMTMGREELRFETVEVGTSKIPGVELLA